MHKLSKILLAVLCMALLLTGCGLRTVDELYCLPKRSDADDDLQAVIDKAMGGLSYSAPIYGENRQSTQKVDLDGDGIEECLLFAKDSSEKPLKILIFCQLASGYVLMDTIEGYGFAFDFVSYAQMDGQPGLEIIVGRQVSNQVMRSVSVYRFSSGFSRHLVSASYTRAVTTDLDGNGNSELLLLKSGEGDNSNAMLSVYQLEEEQIQRTDLADLSAPIEKVKRTLVGCLEGGVPALFVTSLDRENCLVTDVFTLQNKKFTCIRAKQSVASLGKEYVYPEDVDGDGVIELPSLVPMAFHPDSPQEYYIRWYSMDRDGKETDKLCTYLNEKDGWYMTLLEQWLDRISVVRDREETILYMWDAGHQSAKKIMTVYTLTDSDREAIAAQKGYITLYKGDAVIFAAVLEPSSAVYGITEETLESIFHLVRTELNTDEK